MISVPVRFFFSELTNKMESVKVDIRNVKTVENYAKAFGISKPTVYKRIKSGDIKTVKIDGVTFVRV